MASNRGYDYLILGAGPAGLQLAYFLERAGRDYLVLEAGERPGRFFETFPRHRRLLSINKVYTGYDDPEVNLRWDWNSLLDDDAPRFKEYSREYLPSAEDLVRYLGDYASRHGLRVRYGTRAERVDREGRDGPFRVVDSAGGELRARRLVVATGLSRPYVPAIPGIELAEQYADVSVDPQGFVNQRVLVLGKGNSAFETAQHLIGTAAAIHLVSPEPVRMAWQTHFVGHLRAVNNPILDSYQLKSQNAVLDATVERIAREGERFTVTFSYTHAGGEREELRYDRVIACTGFCFDDSIFAPAVRPELMLARRLPAQTCEWESVNVPGLFFAGTLTQARDYRKSTSAFIHGFRYNVRALHRMLERRDHGREWPSRAVEATPAGLVETVIARINRTSALWQQFGFLADVILVDGEGPARCYEELPVDYAAASDFGRHPHRYQVTLEYGPDHAFANPFAVERIHREDVASAGRSSFLHPIVRRFEGPRLVAEHHVIEDLAAEWVEEVHTRPLLEFFADDLAVPARAAAR